MIKEKYGRYHLRYSINANIIAAMRAIPGDGYFSGNTYIVEKTPETTNYLIEHFGMAGEKINKSGIHNIKTGDWALSWAPYTHQKEAFKLAWDKEYFAWFLDMGTGKTALALLNAAWLAWQDKINAVLVIAPSGVHYKWVDDIYKFWPMRCLPAAAAAFSSTMRKKEAEQVKFVLSGETGGVRILTINIEALSTATGKGMSLAKKFLQRYHAMVIIDESHLIKTPSAKRTRRIISLGKFAAYRRILSGTPGQPLDYYSQFNFLSPKILSFSTFESFKNYFAVMVELPKKRDKRGRPIKIVATDYKGKKIYRNTEVLARLVKPYHIRIQKDDCLDLPAKNYEFIPVELSAKQRKYYETIKKDLLLEFEGKLISAPAAIQKMMRFRQIIGGYLPGENSVAPIDEVNPRIEAVQKTINDIDERYKIIIWACFQAEITAIYDSLITEYGVGAAVKYYGGTSRDEKQAALHDFRGGDARFFVSNPACGGIGLDLYEASYAIFYSNSYSLIDRLQAEDRIHRIGQKQKCVYLDCFAKNTIDEKIVNALVQKRILEAELTGDTITEWLRGEDVR